MYPVVASCVGINSKGPQLQPCLVTATNIRCQLSSVFNIEICVLLHCYRVSLKHFTVLYVQLRGFTKAYVFESLYFPRTHGFSCFVEILSIKLPYCKNFCCLQLNLANGRIAGFLKKSFYQFCIFLCFMFMMVWDAINAYILAYYTVSHPKDCVICIRCETYILSVRKRFIYPFAF